MPPYNQEAEERSNAKSIERLEEAVKTLTSEIQTLTGTVSSYVAAQTVRCNAATSMLSRHETTIMGDGDSRQGLGTKIASLSLQVKLVMAVLSAVSMTTLGLTANIILKAL